MLHLLSDIFPMLTLYSWWTFRLLSPVLSGWISVMRVKAYWSHLFLEVYCSCATCCSCMLTNVGFVTLYTRRDSCSLLYARVGCCLFYLRCTGFTFDVYLVALFRFLRYTDLYLQCFRVQLTSFCESLCRVFSPRTPYTSKNFCLPGK